MRIEAYLAVRTTEKFNQVLQTTYMKALKN